MQTLSLATREPYDPAAPRDLSPIRLGRFIVLRSIVPGTTNTRYQITLRGATLGSQLSSPSLDDCEALERRELVRIITNAPSKPPKHKRGWRATQIAEAKRSRKVPA